MVRLIQLCSLAPALNMARICRALPAIAALVIVSAPFCAPARAADSDVPRFVVDPYWPKPLPDRWVTGAVGGVCVDRQDHVFGVNRSDLTAMEQTVGKQPEIGRAHV